MTQQELNEEYHEQLVKDSRYKAISALIDARDELSTMAGHGELGDMLTASADVWSVTVQTLIDEMTAEKDPKIYEDNEELTDLQQADVDLMAEPLFEGVGLIYKNGVASYAVDGSEYPLVFIRDNGALYEFDAVLGEMAKLRQGAPMVAKYKKNQEARLFEIDYNTDGDAYVWFKYKDSHETDGLILHDELGKAYKFNKYNGLLRMPLYNVKN